MKILVIGGTYFLGRVFTIVAARENHELFLINRGTYTMNMPSVTEYHLDRHDMDSLKNCLIRNMMRLWIFVPICQRMQTVCLEIFRER